MAWRLGLTATCFLHLSPWRNWLCTMGGDKESARSAGIPTNKFTIALFFLP